MILIKYESIQTCEAGNLYTAKLCRVPLQQI